MNHRVTKTPTAGVNVRRETTLIVWNGLVMLLLAPGPVGDHYRKLPRAKGKPKATVAAARQFCTYLYWMLKEEWSYTEWLRQHDRSEVRPIQPLGSAAQGVPGNTNGPPASHQAPVQIGRRGA
jgi:hypothetical protein